jgi:lipopolysaccharide transport system ATP-binding protein
MSSNHVAISMRGLSKAYRLLRQGQQHSTIREAISHRVRHPLSRSRYEEFWALRLVSLDVRRGEVLGLIGRNGAGKSTLLKILSRITPPTTGEVRVHGRVGSLLEAGAGFHPDLTGRENVYLNGVILGMQRREIDRQFDAIVEFSGVERFIDTPVKRYSSGMFIRLAFSVAAHLQAEILMIDEVLAVGDAEFQRKCLGKMEDVAGAGRTVVFVSHAMPAIARMCQRVALLDGGTVSYVGPASEAIEQYLYNGQTRVSCERHWPAGPAAPGDDVVRLRGVRVLNDDGAPASAVDIRCPLGIQLEFDVLRESAPILPVLYFHHESGGCAFTAVDLDPEWRLRTRPLGRFRTTAWLGGNELTEGRYTVAVALGSTQPGLTHCHENEAVGFQVMDTIDGDSARGDYSGTMPGMMRPRMNWSTSYVPVSKSELVGPSVDGHR